MKVFVIGAGAWGTALAVNACQKAGNQVTLWLRDAASAQVLQQTRENTRYLPGITLPSALQLAYGDCADLLRQQDLIVIATPMAGLRECLLRLRSSAVPVVWLCKGFEAAGQPALGLMGHEVQAQIAPGLAAGVLNGPSFAQEVALGQPTALVAASAHLAVRTAMVQAFHNSSLRVYASDDVVGVEVGGAVKNVLAIATGLCDGLALGLNARAAVLTRGLSEMSRLGIALGARAQTFMGLSGLGDLVLTATGNLSRNRQVGLSLASGKTLQQAVDALGHVAEGVACARAVLQRAQGLGIEMPITQCVVRLLDGDLQPAQALLQLMEREPGLEIGAA
jgi:glycerol-3-phosphate dehydrogenase (NAD(P)+)